MRVLATALVLAALAAGCGEAADARPDAVRVVATTGMIADLARVIGGDEVAVTALMGPGVDPHLYKASALDLDRLRGARLILYNGLGLEGRMGDLFVKLARKQAVVAVTEAIDPARLLEPPELEGHLDPHLWFDVGLWAETTTVVAEALAAVAPAHAALFRSRGRAYRTELRALHEEVKRELATIPARRRVLLTSHDAFRYFGRAYDLEVAGLQGISTVDDPGVKDIQEMAELILKRGIKALFVESSVSPKAIQAVHEWVRRRGHEIRIGGTLFSDAMGDAPPTDTYVGVVRFNTRTIVEALR
ncbi:MAG: metal ABC transporter solute-binding protein, Zn/Mn family [Planctomycetota bacterium]